MTKHFENNFGQAIDIELFKETIKCANRTREKMIEINRLRINTECPLAGSTALGFIVPSHFLFGSGDAEEFYNFLLHDIKEGIKISENRSNRHKMDNKKIKILWLEVKPYYSNEILSYVENKLCVKIVFEEINHIYWDEMDPEKPYESLAKRMISTHYNGPLERRIKVIKTLAKRYNVEGVMMLSSWGCRRNDAAIPIIKKELNRGGFPFLVLYGDCIDDSSSNKGQLINRIESFVEMLR